MRVIGMYDVDQFCSRQPAARAAIDALLAIIHRAEWRNTQQAQHQFGASGHIDGPNKIRVEMPEHGVRVEMVADFRDGAVRLKLSPRPKKAS